MTQIKRIPADRINNIDEILKKILTVLLLPLVSIIGQVENSNSDSLKSSPTSLFEKPMTLQSIDQLQIPVGFYSNFTAYPELEFLELSQLVSINQPPDFKLIQNDLLKNFKQSMQWKENYNLGVFGKYLGYAMSAAAVGFGAASIAKYGKDYFGSKKRKKK